MAGAENVFSVHPNQETLFPVRTRTVVIDYSRPDGTPLTEADFDQLASIASRSMTLTAGPIYCTDPQCIEDECSTSEPCCSSTCTCPLTEHCTVKDTGDVHTDFDGTLRDVLNCTEHKTDWLK